MALTLHLKYHAVVTIKRACTVLFINWIASIGYGSTPIFRTATPKSYLCHIDFLPGYKLNDILCYLPYCTSTSVTNPKSCARLILAQPGNGNLNMKHYRKSFIARFSFSFYFLKPLCYVPYLFMRVDNFYFAHWNSIQTVLALRLSAVMVYLHSSRNPLFYCWRMRELRRGMKSFLKTLC